MAPLVTETAVSQAANGAERPSLKQQLEQPNETTKENKGLLYPSYFRYFDVNEKLPPTKIFDYTDPGTRADPAKPNLLGPGVKTSELSPYLGTEVTGVQISQLNTAGLDELALYAAQRKVLVFRDQDFKDLGPDKQIEISRHFGPLQKHPTSGNVKGYAEFHVVYTDAENNRFKELFGTNRINNTSWHSDVSYELQPPGIEIFVILEQPPSGGDTLFASQVEAYNRLSLEFQKRLEGLRALHSAVPQAEHARKHNRPLRREPIETEHPVVRQHPVTGEKALFVNQGFTKKIVGFKVEESEYLLKFLFDHIAKGSDFQIRTRYEPGTVVVWDNRITVHSAIDDYGNVERRHAFRLTPQAEVPIAV
jgi:sulfonate dioxygenase